MFKILGFLVVLLVLAVPVFSQSTGEISDEAQLDGSTPSEFMKLFGISGTLFLQLSLFVTFIVEAFKRRLPTIFIGGWKTHALTILVAFGLSWYVFDGWTFKIIVLTTVMYLVPSGGTAMLKSTTELVKKA